MTLYSEDVNSKTMAEAYPVNALRNRALKQAQTEVVLLDDVDFIVSLGLSHPAQYQAIVQATRRRGAIVVPAFEPAASFRLSEGRKLALDTVQLEDGKGRAAELYSAGKLKPFHLERWDLAHRATDFAKWAGASNFYDIQYEHDFEPYVLVAREGLPAYDERFRGYFENKAVHLRHMASLGYNFLVHPSAFTVHLPHEDSAARLMIIAPANEKLRNQIQGLGESVRRWIDNKTYTPVTSESCASELTAAAERYKMQST